MQIHQANIIKAAKIIGVKPEQMRKEIERAMADKPLTRKQWVKIAHDVILSVPPEFNVERIAEMLYSACVIQKASPKPLKKRNIGRRG